jgi:hypothetical protein
MFAMSASFETLTPASAAMSLIRCPWVVT